MALFGSLCMIGALLTTVFSVVMLFFGRAFARQGADLGDKLTNVGYILLWLATLFLTICVGILVYCFFAGDYSLFYVLQEHSNNTTGLAWLFKLSGVWAGSQGSLLFWAWLIALYASFVAFRRRYVTDELTNIALAIMGIVLAAFVCVLIFSDDNNPFISTVSKLSASSGALDADGNPSAYAMAVYGMNALLEHWAMAIHPPTLFIGYAGLTVPFAYAISALICNDSSRTWVNLSGRITVFAWFFLGLGIGLGAVWAYVVLGWGGYWGWDPVENASLLSWLVGVALIHSFTIYRTRGGFKRWAIMCSCLAFSFVILGTFITRSGLVDSVHAFSGDVVSTVFFLVLVIVSLLAGIVGIIIRRKTFEASEAIESLSSKNTAYYFNSVLMVTVAVLIAYMTLSSALPSWMPFGGTTISTGTYDAIARPLGILYCLLMAICPMLSWKKTDGHEFARNIKWPGIAAVIVFIALLIIYVNELLPIYNTIAAGDNGTTFQSALAAYGPSGYYNALAVIALAVAALLFCDTFYLFVRGVRDRKERRGERGGAAFLHLFTRSHISTGGYLTHLGMAVLLVGLVGSAMFVDEKTPYIDSTPGSQTSIGAYTLTVTDSDVVKDENYNETDTVTLDVTDASGNYIGTVSPSVTFMAYTSQSKLNASVISFPMEDLFVVYQGSTTAGTLSLDIRINPLIWWVWIGFGIMMLGTLIALIPFRARKGDAPRDASAGVSIPAAAADDADSPAPQEA